MRIRIPAKYHHHSKNRTPEAVECPVLRTKIKDRSVSKEDTNGERDDFMNLWDEYKKEQNLIDETKLSKHDAIVKGLFKAREHGHTKAYDKAIFVLTALDIHGYRVVRKPKGKE